MYDDLVIGWCEYKDCKSWMRFRVRSKAHFFV